MYSSLNFANEIIAGVFVLAQICIGVLATLFAVAVMYLHSRAVLSSKSPPMLLLTMFRVSHGAAARNADGGERREAEVEKNNELKLLAVSPLVNCAAHPVEMLQFCRNLMRIATTLQERLVAEIQQSLREIRAEREAAEHREAQWTQLCFRIDLLLLPLFIVIDLATLLILRR